jgi:site-specific DNA-methyltransferase (adenine-specific)
MEKLKDIAPLYFQEESSSIFMMDCVSAMKNYPDNYFDLAVVDPPYGIDGTQEIGFGDTKSERVNRPSKWGQKEWDKERPTKAYFEELKRVSKNQIIFGGNYFADLLQPSRCWIVWDKMQRVNQADAELAWTSFTNSVRVYQFHCSKLQGFQNPNRFHPTEKPISLYDWIFEKYGKIKCDHKHRENERSLCTDCRNSNVKILDTHLGSGSSRIAAHKAGMDFTGFEIDEDYFRASNKRFKDYHSQLTLFSHVS